MNYHESFNLLHLVLQTPGALPPLIWGQCGIGKTQGVYQLAERLDLPLVETVIASIREPSDFAGLPIVGNGGGVRMEPPGWAVRLAEKGSGLLFLDELSCATPAVAGALLRVVLERTVGDLVLPEGVKIVAAANPAEEAVGGWELADPVANRFWHLHLPTPSSSEWIDWLTGTAGSRNSGKVAEQSDWQDAWPQAKALVATYLRTRPVMSEEPKAFAARHPKAFARPRTWECATRLLATAIATQRLDAIPSLLAGAIGEPIAMEFAAWHDTMDLVPPRDLLMDPARYKPDPQRTDRVFAQVMACTTTACDLFAREKKSLAEKCWDNCWEILDRTLPIGEEYVVYGVGQLARFARNGHAGLLNRPGVTDVANKIMPIVQIIHHSNDEGE